MTALTGGRTSDIMVDTVIISEKFYLFKTIAGHNNKMDCVAVTMVKLLWIWIFSIMYVFVSKFKRAYVYEEINISRWYVTLTA